MAPLAFWLVWLGFWLAFWLAFWLVWFGLASGWFGLAPGWLSGWFGLVWFGLVWLLAGFLAGLAWLSFFPVFFSSPCRNAAAGHFASISRGLYFAASRLHAAF